MESTSSHRGSSSVPIAKMRDGTDDDRQRDRARDRRGRTGVGAPRALSCVDPRRRAGKGTRRSEADTVKAARRLYPYPCWILPLGSFPGALLRTLVAHSAIACIAREMRMARTVSRLNGFVPQIRRAGTETAPSVASMPALRALSSGEPAGRVARVAVLPTPHPGEGWCSVGARAVRSYCTTNNQPLTQSHVVRVRATSGASGGSLRAGARGRARRGSSRRRRSRHWH